MDFFYSFYVPKTIKFVLFFTKVILRLSFQRFLSLLSDLNLKFGIRCHKVQL